MGVCVCGGRALPSPPPTPRGHFVVNHFTVSVLRQSSHPQCALNKQAFEVEKSNQFEDISIVSDICIFLSFGLFGAVLLS